MSVRFGVVTTAASAEEMLAVMARCERAGFDAAAWGDHWMGLFPPEVADDGRDGAPDRWYHALALLAFAAERTERVRLVIGVTDLLRRHPADVAQALLTVAELHPDRELVVGVGLGEAENVTPFGLGFHQRVGRLREAIELLRAFTARGRVDRFDGEHFRLRDAVLEPRRGTTQVRIWVAAHGPRMLALCGEQGDGWYPLASSPRHYGRQLTAIRDAASAAGRDPDDVEAGLAVNVCVVDDAAEADAAAADPIMRGFALWSPGSLFRACGLDEHPLASVGDGFRHYVPAAVPAAEYRNAIERVPPAAVARVVLAGTPEAIAGTLAEYEAAGARTIFLWDVNRMRGLPGREPDVAAAYAGEAVESNQTPG